MNENSKLFPLDLLEHSAAQRFRYFAECTIAHPLLRQTDEHLRSLIQSASPGSIIFVLGPTGVGKSTLYKRMRQKLSENFLLQTDVNYDQIPVIGISAVAAETGTFDWKYFYREILEQLNDPIPGYKIDSDKWKVSNGGGDQKFWDAESLRVLRDPKSSLRAYRRACEIGLQHRKPTLFVDEGQHIAAVGSGRRLNDQMDALKSFVDRSGTAVVLFGTYDLSRFFNLSGQLSRRDHRIHFERYDYDKLVFKNQTGFQCFQNILQMFENHLPLREKSNLISYSDFFYERSVGCVGTLKDLLNKALHAALSDNAAALDFSRHIEPYALSLVQIETIITEIKNGENELVFNSQRKSRLHELLGMKSNNEFSTENKLPAPPVSASHPQLNGTAAVPKSQAKRKNRVGVRNPKRDPIGKVAG